MVIYIHQNPQKHGLNEDFKQWPYSSFFQICDGIESFLETQEIFAWFNGREKMRYAHQFRLDLGDDD